MSPILLLVILLLLFAVLPAYPYSRSWGYYPSGLLFVVLIILIIMYLR